MGKRRMRCTDPNCPGRAELCSAPSRAAQLCGAQRSTRAQQGAHCPSELRLPKHVSKRADDGNHHACLGAGLCLNSQQGPPAPCPGQSHSLAVAQEPLEDTGLG